MNSPTQRSLALLRSRGYRAAVVEKWIAQARRRVDLWGCIDVLGITPNGDVIAVQATSGSNVSDRVKKLTDSEALPDMRAAGWAIHVHGWRKNTKGRWVCREVDCS